MTSGTILPIHLMTKELVIRDMIIICGILCMAYGNNTIGDFTTLNKNMQHCLKCNFLQM